jgi:predicted nuclease of predicted toxin-antitoxin system
MRIKLDENLPVSLVAFLARLGHDPDTVSAEGLVGQKDPTIWESAQRAQRFFITQDLDFSDIRLFPPGSHFGILLIRLPAPGRLALLERLREVFQTHPVESWGGCLVVVTESKVRVRRPAGHDGPEPPAPG